MRTRYSTSRYRGGRRAASTTTGGKLGRRGQFISRGQRYYDIRKATGLSAG